VTYLLSLLSMDSVPPCNAGVCVGAFAFMCGRMRVGSSDSFLTPADGVSSRALAASKSYVPVPTRDRYKDKTKSKQTLPESKFQKSSEDGCPCQTLRVVIAGRVFTLVFNRKQKLRLVYSRDIKIEVR